MAAINVAMTDVVFLDGVVVHAGVTKLG